MKLEPIPANRSLVVRGQEKCRSAGKGPAGPRRHVRWFADRLFPEMPSRMQRELENRLQILVEEMEPFQELGTSEFIERYAREHSEELIRNADEIQRQQMELFEPGEFGVLLTQHARETYRRASWRFQAMRLAVGWRDYGGPDGPPVADPDVSALEMDADQKSELTRAKLRKVAAFRKQLKRRHRDLEEDERERLVQEYADSLDEEKKVPGEIH